MTRAEIIARLEAGEVGRQIDAAVAVVAGIVDPERRIGGFAVLEWMADRPEEAETIAAFFGVGRFSTSIDSAMTLLPTGWSVKLHLHPGENFADVYLLGEFEINTRAIVRGPFEGMAPTPAAALVAAALRAMEGE